MKAKPHPEQGFRSCLGILRLEKSYGAQRLEAACRRGNDIGATSYGSIASILKHGLDKAFRPRPPRTPTDPARQHPRPRLLPLTSKKETYAHASTPTNAWSRSGSPAWPRRSRISNANPTSPRSTFEERLALMIDREAIERENKRLIARLKFASPAPDRRRRGCRPERAARPRPRLFAKLVAGDWIGRHQNLLIIGPTGVGKSWIACALGHKACRDDRSVLYHRVPRLFDALALARGDGRHARLLKTLSTRRAADPRRLGPRPADRRAAPRSPRRSSTIGTSAARPSSPASCRSITGTRSSPIPTIADAILDRLVHNAHRLTLKGDSMRKITAQRANLDAAKKT